MELLCIDGTFSSQQQAIIPNRPEEGKIYTIREIFRVRKGTGWKFAVHLMEIENPLLQDGEFMFEPSFKIERFAKLDQSPINSLELYREWKKIKRLEKINYD